mgnify:CR=1 FL=1
MRTNTRVEFGLYDVTARGDSAPSCTTAKPFCNLGRDLLLESVPSQSKYGTLESEQWLMDGSFAFFPEVPEQYFWGLWSATQSDKSGVFAAADHGTLFLDEVGNLNMETQVQLLRALQEKRYKLVGGTEEMHADVRLLAATNEDLEQAISEGRFREDLFHRLNEFPLHVPPLIDCREDIIPLAGFFLSFANEELEKKIRGFDRDVREAFVSYPWPGNIRELKNVVRRACVLAQGGWITLKEISLPVNVPPSNNYRLDMERTEQEAIQKALETTGNDRKAAARLLGISRSTLYLKLKKYGLI